MRTVDHLAIHRTMGDLRQARALLAHPLSRMLCGLARLPCLGALEWALSLPVQTTLAAMWAACMDENWLRWMASEAAISQQRVTAEPDQEGQREEHPDCPE